MGLNLDHLAQEVSGFLQEARISMQFSVPILYSRLEKLFGNAGFRGRAEGGVKTILVLRLDAMGDNVLTTPVLRELRRNCSSAYITLVTSPAAYPLMELCPYVNEVHSFQLIPWRSFHWETLEEIIVFCRQYLWKMRYDLCICPRWGSKPTEERLFAYMSGARERWGYSDLVNNFYMPDPVAPDEEKYLLTHAIRNPPELIHEAERYIFMLEAMGMQIADRRPEIWLAAGDLSTAKKLLGSFGKGGVLVALSTGVGPAGGSRKYPLGQWRDAMEGIVQRGGRFVLLGGMREKAEGKFLRDHLPAGSVLDLTGKTSLRESVAVVSLADIFMGNDTGVMHAAASCRKPIIAVYREAMDKEKVCTGVLSEFRRFEPYMTDYIVLRPEHALDGCRDILCYGGCALPEAHCISQVQPGEIVEAFSLMARKKGYI